jgi:hypothetical protein
MRTEDLIADLASRVTPTRPLRSPAIRLAAWSGLAAACAVVGLVVFGTRPHVVELISQRSFLATAGLSLGTTVFAALAALVLAIPGARREAALQGAALALLGCWASLLAAGFIRSGLGFTSDAHWPICFVRVVAIGAIPAVVLLGMLRRAAPLRLGAAGGLAVIASMALAAGVIQFICPLDAPDHVLRGHFAPVLAMSLLSLWLAPRWLARPR